MKLFGMVCLGGKNGIRIFQACWYGEFKAENNVVSFADIIDISSTDAAGIRREERI